MYVLQTNKIGRLRFTINRHVITCPCSNHMTTNIGQLFYLVWGCRVRERLGETDKKKLPTPLGLTNTANNNINNKTRPHLHLKNNLLRFTLRFCCNCCRQTNRNRKLMIQQKEKKNTFKTRQHLSKHICYTVIDQELEPFRTLTLTNKPNDSIERRSLQISVNLSFGSVQLK